MAVKMQLMHTLEVKPCAIVLEIIDSAEKDLHVQNKFLRHPDGIKVLPIADLPQHIRNARSTGFLKSGKDAGKATLATFKDTSVEITHVQIRYTSCSILTCLSLREIGVSRFSSSTYEGSSSDPSLIEPLDLRETTLTFQNYTIQ